MKVSFWVVPACVILAAAAGLGSSRLLEAPSVVRVYGGTFRGDPAKVSFTVRGLKCSDTAKTFSRQFEEIPGVLKLEAYASTHEARIQYDPAMTNTRTLIESASEPVFDPETGAISFGVFEVLEVDGEPVRHPRDAD